MLSRTSTPMRRRLTRVAVAGALIALPLAGLAATASAEAPAAAGIPLTQTEGTDISAHPRGGPGPDGRVEFRDGPGRHGDGPRIYKNDPGPRIFQDGRPPSGSAGSS